MSIFWNMYNEELYDNSLLHSGTKLIVQNNITMYLYSFLTSKKFSFLIILNEMSFNESCVPPRLFGRGRRMEERRAYILIWFQFFVD